MELYNNLETDIFIFYVLIPDIFNF